MSSSQIRPQSDTKTTTKFSTVLAAELAEIDWRRAGEKDQKPLNLENVPADRPEAEVIANAHKHRLFGVAFSGGGIRSATFNLGVLQFLAESNLLRRVDYLSTVSGGGYIGSWLQSMIANTASTGDPLDEVRRKLSPPGSNHNHSGKMPLPKRPSEESAEIRSLREYSNYLTPRKGLLTIDSLTLGGLYGLNLFANIIILALVLLALVTLPAIVEPMVNFLSSHTQGFLFRMIVFFFLACLGLSFPIVFACYNLAQLGEQQQSNEKKNWISTTPGILTSIVLPAILFAAILSKYVQDAKDQAHDEIISWCLIGGFLYALAWFGASSVVWFFISTEKNDQTKLNDRLKQWWLMKGEGFRKQFRLTLVPLIIGAGVAGCIGGMLLACLYPLVTSTGSDEYIVYFVLTVLVVIIVAALHNIFSARSFTDEAREWWARLGAYMLFIVVAISALSVIALDTHIISALKSGVLFITDIISPSAIVGAFILMWLGITITGAIVGSSPRSRVRKNTSFPDRVASASPYVFILGLLLLLSWLSRSVLLSLMPVSDPLKSEKNLIYLCECILAVLAVAWLLSEQVNINEFSLHNLYRNRLIRCYLGATNLARQAQPFIGFDRNDDMPLEQLREKKGPYPIINTAINLVAGERLAWQERKAGSFFITPRYCGYEFPVEAKKNGRIPISSAICPIEGYTQSGKRKRRMASDSEIMTLGNAMAISGAAASPNMGYHSSPPLAFLMTVFNVRLGYWLLHPRYAADPNSSKTPTPPSALRYLLYELLGKTSDNSTYVNISDGGHFENLGIYELVRRRCAFIVASDAGADPQMAFGDLGNAVEKCRTDFGIDIEIDITPIRIDAETGRSAWHCAIGKIRYDRADANASPGILLYMKASLTGDEPADLQSYAEKVPLFPHESTADQWFDESQFESYRMLGNHIARSVIVSAVGTSPALPQNGVVFDSLRKHWFPPSRHVQENFSRHTETLNGIMTTIRNTPDLRFLDSQIYPEWPAMMGRNGGGSQRELFWLPKREEELRAGFYLCNEMIQLMENVYIDLDLESEWEHPDNRGWMNLFRHWSWAGMFRVTWSICASTYGARFQTFCEHHLDLRLGTVRVGPTPVLFPWSMSAGESREMAETYDRWVNVVENDIISRFIENNGVKTPLPLYPVFLEVANPFEPNQRINMNIGIIGIRIDDEKNGHEDGKVGRIQFFRIRDHLRNMGLGRQALAVLQRDLGLRTIDMDEQSFFKTDEGKEMFLQCKALMDSARDEVMEVQEGG